MRPVTIRRSSEWEDSSSKLFKTTERTNKIEEEKRVALEYAKFKDIEMANLESRVKELEGKIETIQKEKITLIEEGKKKDKKIKKLQVQWIDRQEVEDKEVILGNLRDAVESILGELKEAPAKEKKKIAFTQLAEQVKGDYENVLKEHRDDFERFRTSLLSETEAPTTSGKTLEKKNPTPDRRRRPEGTKKSEPAGVKPVTERVRKPEIKKTSDLFKIASNRSKPVADSPSNRTRGAKRKAKEPSDTEGPHQRRKLQLQSDVYDESTEETTGETLGSDEETTASSDSGDGTEQSTPSHKQDDSTPESEQKQRKFGGQIVEEESESSIDGDAAVVLNPLLGALEDAGELQRAEHIPDGTEYFEDVEPAVVVAKEPARSPFTPKKPPIGQDEAQLDTVMEEGQDKPGQTGWEPEEARPAHIRKNTKDVRVSTMVNQTVTSAIHHLEKRIQVNEDAIRKLDKELAAARKAAPAGMNLSGSRVTQVQSQTATGLLIQMETLNPNQLRSVQTASVPVTQLGQPIFTKANSSTNPVVNGRIALPPVITSGLASTPVVTSSQTTVPITVTTAASVLATTIPSSSVQVPDSATVSAADQQAAVSAPDRAQEQVSIPVTTTTPSVVTITQADGTRYSLEYQRDVKGKQLEEPAIVKLNHHFGNMANPLRP
ncbi:hypothetical protein R1sor_022868 [Riccia sorocarpa]|uniref:Uncharacterized protein n=1 Tax=Riccia sorocarpa TaxID=122646 RepID=A0ABD3GP34_9MARC